MGLVRLKNTVSANRSHNCRRLSSCHISRASFGSAVCRGQTSPSRSRVLEDIWMFPPTAMVREYGARGGKRGCRSAWPNGKWSRSLPRPEGRIQFCYVVTMLRQRQGLEIEVTSSSQTHTRDNYHLHEMKRLAAERMQRCIGTKANKRVSRE